MSEENTTAIERRSMVDNGKHTLANPAAFDQAWRAAKLFASSDLVPKDYRDKAANCFIAMEMADRMGINPFAVMQNLCVINGRPAMEAKLIIALVNDSNLFVDPIEYEIDGEDPHDDKYRVRAFAVMSKTGKTCYGPWITWKMVKGEGWHSKSGSKWQTMPSIMFLYRAASFFAKIYAPNITMGMQSREEMEDSIDAEYKQLSSRSLEQSVSSANGVISTGFRERGKPSPGRQRRTAAEVEEDRISDEADNDVVVGHGHVNVIVDPDAGESVDCQPVYMDDDFPDPPKDTK